MELDFFFRCRSLLCNTGWSQICGNPPASASLVLFTDMCHHTELQPGFQTIQHSDLEAFSLGGLCAAGWHAPTYILDFQGWRAMFCFLCSSHSALQTLCELSIWVELKKQEHQKQNEKHMTKPAKMCDICVKEWYPEHRKTMNVAIEMEKNREFMKVMYLKVF